MERKTRAPANLAEQLDPARTQVLLIDMQQKLLPHIHGHQAITAACERMLRAAVLFDLPITITQQYTQGLGATAPALLAAAPDAERIEKMSFSVCDEPTGRDRLVSAMRQQVIVMGIETHVCVQQTALDLVNLQMRPYLLLDAVGSRRPLDHEVAVERMQHADVVVSTVESAIFRLLRVSGTDLFRRVLPLVK